MTQINLLILKCFTRIKNERTIYSVYHLLNGRSSIQTLQDAHLYELTELYGIYKKLTLKEFDEIIAELEDKQLIQQLDQTKYYLVTHKGLKLVENTPLQNQFNGLLYEQISDEFYQRLSLFIQVWTNSNQKNANYIPVIDNYKTENFIKQLYINRKKLIQQDLKQLYEELTILLEKTPEKHRLYYIDRFSGYDHYGLSIPQLAQKYQTDQHTIQLSLTAINHFIIKHTLNNPTRFKIIYLLISTLSMNNKLTKSASQTNKLLKKHTNLESIARIRDLKLSTIYDHLVEIALYNPNFPINDFVSMSEQEEIINYVKNNNSFKLKEIKDNVSGEINYFQIRLVLSMMSSIEEGVENKIT